MKAKLPDSGASAGAVTLPPRFALVSARPPATAATRRPIAPRSPRLRCAAPSPRSAHATHAATIAAGADPALLVGAGGSIALLPVAAAAAALPPRRHAPRRRASPLPPPTPTPPAPALPPGADGVSLAPHPASAPRGSAAHSAGLRRTATAVSATCVQDPSRARDHRNHARPRDPPSLTLRPRSVFPRRSRAQGVAAAPGTVYATSLISGGARVTARQSRSFG